MHPIAKNILLHYVRLFSKPQTTGRPRAFSVEYIIDRIEFVLRTGCQWSNLPVEYGSRKTIYHYFSKWSKANIFEKAFHDLVSFYLKQMGFSNEVIVDTSFIKNVYGKDCIGRSPVDRGRKATKLSAIVDSSGIPLHILFHPGNKSDCKTLDHLLAKTCKHINLAGKQMFGDKAYDTKHCSEMVNHFGMTNRISKKRQSTPKIVNRTRIAVEHTFGWLDKSRRIIMRFDSLVCHFRSFHCIAIMQLIAKRLPVI